jgi:hypothetical protein
MRRDQADEADGAGHRDRAADAERELAAVRADVDRLSKRRDAITAQLASLSEVISGFAKDKDDE